MKLLLAIAALCVTFMASAQSKQTVVIKTPNTCNHCKICETCGGKLEKDLYFVRGIKLVTYNEADQTTTVVYKTKLITPEKIRQEIAKLGFDADSVPADPKGYEQRDGCCKN
ncbi:MAG TPA: cation transporter [Fluviicola sp.]|nr:cation transporter [Fluviicola sp.]